MSMLSCKFHTHGYVYTVWWDDKFLAGCQQVLDNLSLSWMRVNTQKRASYQRLGSTCYYDDHDKIYNSWSVIHIHLLKQRIHSKKKDYKRRIVKVIHNKTHANSNDILFPRFYCSNGGGEHCCEQNDLVKNSYSSHHGTRAKCSGEIWIKKREKDNFGDYAKAASTTCSIAA